MLESLQEQIERFTLYNREAIEVACTIDNLSHQAIHAKVLLCAIIDSLAMSCFPDKKLNKQRFVDAIRNHSNWTEMDRVSLLHLKRMFEVHRPEKRDFNRVEEWVANEFSSRYLDCGGLVKPKNEQYGDIVLDPTLEELVSKWPENLKLDKKSPEDFTHLYLLWHYRNSLVHEYRSPGRGWEPRGNESREPHYQVVVTVETGFEKGSKFSSSRNWELVYPWEFFRCLALTMVENIAEYHRQNGSSPFTAYSDSSFWIPGLGEEC